MIKSRTKIILAFLTLVTSIKEESTFYKHKQSIYTFLHKIYKTRRQVLNIDLPLSNPVSLPQEALMFASKSGKYEDTSSKKKMKEKKRGIRVTLHLLVLKQIIWR